MFIAKFSDAFYNGSNWEVGDSWGSSQDMTSEKGETLEDFISRMKQGITLHKCDYSLSEEEDEIYESSGVFATILKDGEEIEEIQIKPTWI